MEYEPTTNLVASRETALIKNIPALRVTEELTESQLCQIELVTARFNENLQGNAVDYDAADEMAAEMELEYA
ncbi:hypothetical protein [Exiguobacterium undae]|uniref:hypothetical protein n=1 Tax=Exiguobacterium undae TaxID=169177 RepID=UPI00047BDC81|nr:hypothetical protein [Exiguobacterium undae]